MVNIAICDENPIRTKQICDMLNDILSPQGIQYRITSVNDGSDLMMLLADDAAGIAVVFLDFSHISGDNKALAAEIKERFPQVTVFDASHVDRHNNVISEDLVRPMATHVLMNALGRTLRETDYGKNKILTVKAKGAVHNFMINAIEYIMSDRRLIMIRESGKESVVYAKLDDIEEKVGPGFVRCHQSYLVNMSCIKTFDNKKITLFSDAVIPISQKRRIQAREKYYRFLGNSILYK